MAKKSAKTADNQFAELVIEKATEQVKLLLGRNWNDIARIMKKDSGEIKVNMGLTITDREATPESQADKDNRIRLAISFAEKHSDSTETDLPDPDQPPLPLESE